MLGSPLGCPFFLFSKPPIAFMFRQEQCPKSVATTSNTFEISKRYQALLTRRACLPMKDISNVSLRIEKFAWTLECRDTYTNAQSMNPSHLDKQWRSNTPPRHCRLRTVRWCRDYPVRKKKKGSKGLTQHHLMLDCDWVFFVGKIAVFYYGPHTE